MMGPAVNAASTRARAKPGDSPQPHTAAINSSKAAGATKERRRLSNNFQQWMALKPYFRGCSKKGKSCQSPRVQR